MENTIINALIKCEVLTIGMGKAEFDTALSQVSDWLILNNERLFLAYKGEEAPDEKAPS